MPDGRTNEVEFGTMRVLHVITGLSTGGAERMLHRLLGARDGVHHAAVISLMDHGDLGTAIEDLGVPVHALGIRKNRPRPHAYFELRRRVAIERPDILHGWMYHGSLAATLSGFGGPVIWGIRNSLHDVRYHKWNTRAVIRALTFLPARPSAIVYCAETSARQHEVIGFPADKTCVIPNGFECGRFRPDERLRWKARGELGLKDASFIVGHVARFHPMKDHITFLMAAAILKNHVPEAYFVLAGRGVDEGNQALTAAVQELDLGDRLRLLGQRANVPELMNAFDVFATSSAWGEAFSNVLAEAMACGVPCVGTDVGDSARIVGDTGRIVPPRNPEALAAALEELIALGPDGRARLKQAARQRVLDRYRLEAVAGYYQALYGRLASET